MRAEFAAGIVVPLRPFFGSMGVAPPPEAGRVSSNPPGRHAGNLDNRELVAGSTLYIPVFARGALFEVGDGHVAEGDGEVDRMATDPDLLIATKTAIQEMVDFLIAEKHLTRHEAYQLVSTAGNVAVTQLVDKPNVAVHVRLPNSLFVAD
jgi:acetamidase/formamidase